MGTNLQICHNSEADSHTLQETILLAQFTSEHSAVLLQTHELANMLEQENLILIDMRSENDYLAGHIPGARHLPYASIVREAHPVGGLLPQAEQFNAVLQQLGVRTDSLVVSYDAAGGAAASRLIWTLHVFGFTNACLLNGGFPAWAADGHPLSTAIPDITPSQIALKPGSSATIDTDTLLAKLDDDPPIILDARTKQEFTGENVRAKHGGRIPGAIHFEWTDALDMNNASRLLPDATLRQLLEQRGINPAQPVVVYCQTHHRSSLSYTMLLHLGFTRVAGLEGSWSAWGNRDDTPKETGPK